MQVVVLSLGCVRQGSRHHAFYLIYWRHTYESRPPHQDPARIARIRQEERVSFTKDDPAILELRFFCLLRYEVRQIDINSAEMPARSHSAYTIFFSVFRRANHVSTLKCLSKYRTMNSIALALSTSIGGPAVHFCLWFPSLTR